MSENLWRFARILIPEIKDVLNHLVPGHARTAFRPYLPLNY